MAERTALSYFRNPWASASLGVLGGATLLSVGLWANGLVGPQQSPVEAGPKKAEKTAETALEAVNRQLAVADIVGPVATRWTACPTGPGATVLPEYMRVNAYQYPDDIDGRSAVTPTVEIRDVTEYRDMVGRVVAWCGASVGRIDAGDISRPPVGQIVVIPNIDPDCPPSQSGQMIACPGQAILYDSRPGQPGQSTPLEAAPVPPKLEA